MHSRHGLNAESQGALVYGKRAGLGQPEESDGSLRFKTQVIDTIERLYMQELSTDKMAQILFINKSYFCRQFKATFGQPFLIYLQSFRVQKAKHLNPAAFATLTELAAAVGFPSYYHFSRVFKKNTGMTPHSYFRSLPSAE
ncbi:MAG: AraC family transcriptional regulator [Clostridia bacterium]|nr:AraC family transcriptional regulator [Clostridia bacterium]